MESQALLYFREEMKLTNTPENSGKTPGLVFGADGRAIPVAAEFAPDADKYNAALDKLQQEATPTMAQPNATNETSATVAKPTPKGAAGKFKADDSTTYPEGWAPTAEPTLASEDNTEFPDPRTSPLYRLVVPLETIRGTDALQLLSETMAIWEAVESENREDNPGIDLAGTRAILRSFESLVVPPQNQAEWAKYDTLQGIGDMISFVMGYIGELGNAARSLNI